MFFQLNYGGVRGLYMDHIELLRGLAAWHAEDSPADITTALNAVIEEVETLRTKLKEQKMSIFHDQNLFMTATDQVPDANLYYELVQEETEELAKAFEQGDMVQIADGIMDSIYVLAGMANCLYGPDKALRLWQEVQRSNMSKVQAIETDEGIKYAVKRREDGKILKPSSYFKPDLESIIGSRCKIAP